MTTPPPPLSSAIDRYLMFLQAEEHKSTLTIRNYAESLRLFDQLTKIDSIDDISKETIKEYKYALHSFRTRRNTELSIRTKNHHLTVLRAFLRYLLQEEERDVYPPDRVTRFQEEPRRVKVLTQDELERLLLAPDSETREGLRDRAMLHLFFSTGMRLQELRMLNRRDINFATRELSVRGKRGKIRVVFLSGRCAAALAAYMDGRVDHLQPLFVRHPGRLANVLPPGEAYRLSRVSIYTIVKKHALKAGIVTDPSPHTLRHSFATDLLRNGADLRSVQELLGHRDLSTTQIYTHVTSPQLKQVHERFHGGGDAR